MLRYVPTNRFCFKRKFNAVPLVLIELTIFILLFALILKGNDNETDKYVDHEECNNNDVYDVVGGNNGTKIVDWTTIFRLGIDGCVKKSEGIV